MADQALAEDADFAELRLARREHWIAQLKRHAAARPGQPAFRFRGATTTWRQFADRVGRLAGAFASRGVRHGDRVAMMTGNCHGPVKQEDRPAGEGIPVLQGGEEVKTLNTVSGATGEEATWLTRC